jgi:hypothetical protein
MLPAIARMRERVSEQSGTRARDVIERQVTHRRRIIDDLLDIARIVQGKVELHKERTDCREVIQDALCSTSPRCQEHDQTLAVSLPDEAIWIEAVSLCPARTRRMMSGSFAMSDGLVVCPSTNPINCLTICVSRGSPPSTRIFVFGRETAREIARAA